MSNKLVVLSTASFEFIKEFITGKGKDYIILCKKITGLTTKASEFSWKVTGEGAVELRFGPEKVSLTPEQGKDLCTYGGMKNLAEFMKVAPTAASISLVTYQKRGTIDTPYVVVILETHPDNAKDLSFNKDEEKLESSPYFYDVLDNDEMFSLENISVVEIDHSSAPSKNKVAGRKSSSTKISRPEL